MKPFFDIEERRSLLNLAAARWLGTPWCQNSREPGKGVSCHFLPTAIYQDCGFLPNDFPSPLGSPVDSQHAKVSVMEQFLDGRPEFVRIPVLDTPKSGDLVGIRIHRVVDHLGVVLYPGWFIHVLMRKHCCKDPLALPPWSQRIMSVWRPVEK